MTITEITETPNTEIKPQKPIKEAMDIYIQDIPEGISRRNGMVYLLVGAGGSGKTSLMLSQFRRGGAYHKKYHHLYYFCPSASFHSVEKHPFQRHDKVYHELTPDALAQLHDELLDRKDKLVEEEEPMEYSLVIIDDLAADLKDKHILKMLNKLLIKARHLNCGFIFTLQSYLYMPRILRKQVTYATVFKPRTRAEWETINGEVLQKEDRDAKKIFDYVFSEPYSHLDIDAFEGILYKNFNRLNITDSDAL